MLSLSNLLVLSLALNVSLILRMVYEREDGHKGCCFNKQRDGHVVHQARLAISSSSSSSPSSSLANFSRANHREARERVINLDQ